MQKKQATPTWLQIPLEMTELFQAQSAQFSSPISFYSWLPPASLLNLRSEGQLASLLGGGGGSQKAAQDTGKNVFKEFVNPPLSRWLTLQTVTSSPAGLCILSYGSCILSSAHLGV